MNIPLLSGFEIILSEDGGHVVVKLTSNDGTSYMTGLNKDATVKLADALAGARTTVFGEAPAAPQPAPPQPKPAPEKPVQKDRAATARKGILGNWKTK